MSMCQRKQKRSRCYVDRNSFTLCMRSLKEQGNQLAGTGHVWPTKPIVHFAMDPVQHVKKALFVGSRWLTCWPTSWSWLNVKLTTEALSQQLCVRLRFAVGTTGNSASVGKTAASTISPNTASDRNARMFCLAMEISSIANDAWHERPCNNELAGDSKANISTMAFAKKLNYLKQPISCWSLSAHLSVQLYLWHCQLFS